MISPEMKECSVCFEKKTENDISKCNNCIESGLMCHNCEIKWANQKKNPKICSVCKKENKTNVSTIAIQIFNNTIDIEVQQTPLEVQQTPSPQENPSWCKLLIIDCSEAWSIISIIFIIIVGSWMWACFSYYIVFRFDNTRGNMFKNPLNILIGLGSGATLFIPMFIIYNKRKAIIEYFW